jgi:hypothetical protein
VLCVACARRCGCGDECAVRSGCGCVGRPAARACGTCVFVCCVCVCDVRCVACLRALFWVTRAMPVTLACRCAGWGLSFRHGVCLRARVRGVMVAGSAAVLVGMCVRCSFDENMKNRGCVILVRAMDDACIAGAVSSAVSSDCGFVSSRVRRCTAFRCGCCVTAQRCVGLYQWLIARVWASRCAVYTRALPLRCTGRVVLRVSIAGSPCCALVRHVSCDRARRSRSVALL